MKVYVVTPCGGCLNDVLKTVDSVAAVAERFSQVQFHQILIFNNGLPGSILDIKEIGNLSLEYHDINPVASVAHARNYALDLLQNFEQGFVNFLDSGDIMLNAPIELLQEKEVDRSLYSFSSIIKNSAGREVLRAPLSVKYKFVLNPFYIGSVYVDSKTAVRYSFDNGRKEDWKYWLRLLEDGVKVFYEKEPAYVYVIKSRGSHLRRKGRLWKEQFVFYREYLGFGYAKSLFFFAAHYLAQAFRWSIVLR